MLKIFVFILFLQIIFSFWNSKITMIYFTKKIHAAYEENTYDILNLRMQTENNS